MAVDILHFVGEVDILQCVRELGWCAEEFRTPQLRTELEVGAREVGAVPHDDPVFALGVDLRVADRVGEVRLGRGEQQSHKQ